MDLGPQIPGDGKLFSCGEHKFRLFKGGNLIHVDDTVPVTAYELGITQQQTRKVMEPHIGSHGLILQVDLDVVVAVVRVQDIVNGQLDHDAAFFYFDIVAALFLGHGSEIVHGLAELSVAQGLYHVVQGTDFIPLQGKICAAGGKDKGALVIILADAFCNTDSGCLSFQKNIYKNKVKCIHVP